jgi:anti-sigma factor RsiW
MQCVDLERYLEAFLDGRLGRSRSAILRRHLMACGTCRARVERLRQFERDMQRRFRSLEPARSLWQGLELSLVPSSGPEADGGLLDPPPSPPAPPGRIEAAGRTQDEAARKALPPPQPARRGRGPRLWGFLLLALVLGAVQQLVRLSLPSGEEDEAAVAAAYRRLAEREQPLAVESDDAGRLQAWLSAVLGQPAPTPPVPPPGFRLVGADRAPLGQGEAGVLVYADAATAPDRPVMLLMRPLPAEGNRAPSPAAPVADAAGSGVHRLAWQADGFRFTLVGEQEAALRQFVD